MKSFLKSFFASYFGSCLGIASLAFLPILIFIVITFVTISEVAPAKPSPLSEKTFLVIDISRGFSDQPTFSAYNRNDSIFSQGQGSYGLLDTLLAVSKAEEDSKICGILLTGTDCCAGLPQLEELRKSLIRFQSSGKPVFAYLPSPTLSDYFLASAAHEIWVHPLSEIPLNGLSSDGIYIKQALEKIGIGIQVVKVGKFKAAVEPLVSESMSEEDRNQRAAILMRQWNKIIDEIARSRKLNASALNQFSAEKGLVPAREALEQKLVDKLYYKDEMLRDVCKAGAVDPDTASFRQIDLSDYIKQKSIAVIPAINDFPEDPENQIAVVYVEGEIVDGYGEIDNAGGERLAETIRGLRSNPYVLAVVLRVNSPGGSVFASEQIRRELELASHSVPVVVSMGHVAASGGYWISTPAKRIFADETTITGSIGVFGILPNLQNLGEKIGISTASVVTSQFAELGTLRRPQTPRELAVFQKSVDDIYEHFTGLVTKSRNLPSDYVKKIAEGRIWDGFTAKRLGLADEIGGLAEAINYTKELIGVPDANLCQYPAPVNPYQPLVDAISTPENLPVIFSGIQAGKNSPAGKLSREMAEFWKKLRALNDPNCIYARLPWDFSTQSR